MNQVSLSKQTRTWYKEASWHDSLTWSSSFPFCFHSAFLPPVCTQTWGLFRHNSWALLCLAKLYLGPFNCDTWMELTPPPGKHHLPVPRSSDTLSSLFLTPSGPYVRLSKAEIRRAVQKLHLNHWHILFNMWGGILLQYISCKLKLSSLLGGGYAEESSLILESWHCRAKAIFSPFSGHSLSTCIFLTTGKALGVY